MSELALFSWVKEVLAARDLEFAGLEFSALSGDAGFRQYWRLNSEPSMLAVFAPPATEDAEQFIRVAQWLRAAGVHAPLVVAHNLERGFLLVEDLGKNMLLDALDSDSVHGLYGEALNALLHIQSAEPDSSLFPPYDAEKLEQEMALFPTWFVEKLLGLTIDEAQRTMLDEAMKVLVESALAQPQVVVHRDFHSRNIVMMDSPELGIIDFQDALIGPLSYDLVSLLKDCYVRWDPELVEKWALAYGAMAESAGLLTDFDQAGFIKAFDLMGLQRHIKVLGIFARLSLRDGKHGYLNDLPLVFEYALEVAERYIELAPLAQYLKREIGPVFHKQAWKRAQ